MHKSVADPNQSFTFWLKPLDGGTGHQITDYTSLRIYSYQWSRDGKRLALAAAIPHQIWF